MDIIVVASCANQLYRPRRGSLRTYLVQQAEVNGPGFAEYIVPFSGDLLSNQDSRRPMGLYPVSVYVLLGTMVTPFGHIPAAARSH